MFRLIPPVFALCLVTLVFGASPAMSQLTNVQWNESLSLDAVPVDSESQVGVSSSTPEPLVGALTGAGYSLSGSVNFTSPGSPNVTSHVDGGYQSGLTFLGGSAYCRIDFEFAARQTSTPPVSVNTVPVNIRVQGTAGVSGNGDMYAFASSAVNIATQSGPLGGWSVQVDNTSGQSSDLFNESSQYLLAPDVIVFGDKTASATISAELLVQNSSATATAWVDPLIEIADELIPGGGGASYRDHFEIEFADGYWALGQVPNRETTWGRIKQLYR